MISVFNYVCKRLHFGQWNWREYFKMVAEQHHLGPVGFLYLRDRFFWIWCCAESVLHRLLLVFLRVHLCFMLAEQQLLSSDFMSGRSRSRCFWSWRSFHFFPCGSSPAIVTDSAWCFTVRLPPPSCLPPLTLLLPCFRTVVKCTIAKSQALYSAQRGLRTNNAAVFKVGSIMINIPQHPATLHSMMVRSSHQLSKQISDLIRQPANAYVPQRQLVGLTELQVQG